MNTKKKESSLNLITFHHSHQVLAAEQLSAVSQPGQEMALEVLQ